ncbi:FecR family protein [Duncaniella sp.]|uniref:FecR family protein n=1 Tax=Duncaniella sp. TaxID=2518496 RepID=UPI0023C3D9E5|nr:FecR family protein [Duncaniella sp.]MDE5905230.1 FecR domain-containing protein [Duncaniella sp.]
MQRISKLFIKRISSRLSTDEEAELQAWRDESEENRRLYERLTDPSYVKAQLDLWQMVDSERSCREMQLEVDRIRRRSRLKSYGVSMAALIAVALGIGVFLYNNIGVGSDGVHMAEVPKKYQTVQTVDEIKPGSTRAMLSDAAGHKVVLNESDTAKVATVLLTTENADSLERNLCLEVPRGGEFKIQLEDGTEVWLNSSSRLYYPKTFSGDVRKVRIEGEAYLAVATDSLRPFYVETDNQQIRVYGTEFNVRYYPDETEVYTTLERGKVSLSRLDEPDAELFLTPGHQAVFRTADQRVRVRPVNTDVVTSWRKGRFVFEHQTLMRIMQDLSRWYDFEYEFTDDSLRGEEFMGSIPRYSDFTTAIAILEKCGGIKFSVSDGKVIVSRSGQ